MAKRAGIILDGPIVEKLRFLRMGITDDLSWQSTRAHAISAPGRPRRPPHTRGGSTRAWTDAPEGVGGLVVPVRAARVPRGAGGKS